MTPTQEELHTLNALAVRVKEVIPSMPGEDVVVDHRTVGRIVAALAADPDAEIVFNGLVRTLRVKALTALLLGGVLLAFAGCDLEPAPTPAAVDCELVASIWCVAERECGVTYPDYAADYLYQDSDCIEQRLNSCSYLVAKGSPLVSPACLQVMAENAPATCDQFYERDREPEACR